MCVYLCLTLANSSLNVLLQVLGSGGDSHLGGEDIDNNLLEHFARLIQQQTNDELDVFASPELLTELKAKCEQLKIALSERESAELTCRCTLAGQKEFVFHGSLDRQELVKMNQDIFTRCLDAVVSVLRDTNTDKMAIDEVILHPPCRVLCVYILAIR